MFQTGLFLKGTFRTDVFYKKYFLCSGFYFHKRMNGKTFIVHHFVNLYQYSKSMLYGAHYLCILEHVVQHYRLLIRY